MTTNYLDRLDPALIRPGRIDLKQYIGHATKHQLLKMYLRFYPEGSHEAAAQFSENVAAANIDYSVAQIQGYFLLHKNDPDAALNNTHLIE